MVHSVDAPARLVLQPSVILDPATRRHLRGHWLLLDGSRIATVGSGVPPPGELVALPGKTVMPGFVDSHGHLAFQHARGPLGPQLEAGRATQLRIALDNMRSRLNQGITLMRDLSERDYLDVEIRARQEAGTIVGPRLRCATRGIKAPGAHGFCGTPFRGPSAIRQAVRENQAAGADLIKLYLTGSPYGTPDELARSAFSQEEVQAAVDEAHGLGLPVAAHAFAGDGIDRALEAGIDCIEHGMFPDDAQVDRMARQGTWLSTTYAYTVGQKAPAGARTGDAQEDAARWEAARRRFQRMLEAGIRIAAGTDEGSGGIADEAHALIALGMPSWTVLQAITIAGARLCRWDDRVGAIRAGLDADLVVLDGDPLADLASLARVHAVLQQGRWFGMEIMKPAGRTHG